MEIQPIIILIATLVASTLYLGLGKGNHHHNGSATPKQPKR